MENMVTMLAKSPNKNKESLDILEKLWNRVKFGSIYRRHHNAAEKIWTSESDTSGLEA